MRHRSRNKNKSFSNIVEPASAPTDEVGAAEVLDALAMPQSDDKKEGQRRESGWLFTGYRSTVYR